jgi:hypothetical protein
MGPLSRDIAGHMCRMSRVSRYQKFCLRTKSRDGVERLSGPLDAWARRLEAIVSGAAASNVVELAKVRG